MWSELLLWYWLYYWRPSIIYRMQRYRCQVWCYSLSLALYPSYNDVQMYYVLRNLSCWVCCYNCQNWNGCLLVQIMVGAVLMLHVQTTFYLICYEFKIKNSSAFWDCIIMQWKKVLICHICQWIEHAKGCCWPSPLTTSIFQVKKARVIIFCSRDDRVCVSDSLLFTFRENTQFRTETTGSGLFCIIRDNCKFLLTQNFNSTWVHSNNITVFTL